jgi:hypothetical protein
MAVYNRFRFGYPLALPAAAYHEPDMGATVAPDGDDLPPSTE